MTDPNPYEPPGTEVQADRDADSEDTPDDFAAAFLLTMLVVSAIIGFSISILQFV